MWEMHTIVAVRRIGSGKSRVYFETGEARDVTWRLYADDGKVFEKLKDPKYATSCRIINGGDALQWPDGVDWSAGAVHQVGVQVSKPVKEQRQTLAKTKPVPIAH